MTWQEPRVDWTEDGRLNFADLNRIEANTLWLSQIPIFIRSLEIEPVVTDWDEHKWPLAREINRIACNVERLKNALYTPTGWQGVKTTWQSRQPLDYRDVKRLENNLLLLYLLAHAILAEYNYAGTYYCGEEVIL